MASGDTLVVFTARDNQPPSAAFATFDTRNGHLVLDFDPTTDEDSIFEGLLPRNYGSGGITLLLVWAATSATSGSCRWQASFERLEDEGTDIDADSFDTAQSAGGTAPAATGALQYTTIAFTNGQIDGLLVGEAFRLKVGRDANGTTGTDDMTGDAELLRAEVKET